MSGLPGVHAQLPAPTAPCRGLGSVMGHPMGALSATAAGKRLSTASLRIVPVKIKT